MAFFFVAVVFSTHLVKLQKISECDVRFAVVGDVELCGVLDPRLLPSDAEGGVPVRDQGLQ